MKRFILAATLLASSMPAFSALILIDDFLTAQGHSFTAAAPQSGGNIVNPTASAIGGERDLWLRKTVGPNGAPISVNINPYDQNLLRFDQGASTRGSARVTWDGVDGNADAINYVGLNNRDFGLASAGYLELVVSFNNILGPIDFVIYDGTDPTGARHAEGTMAIPAGIDLDHDTDPLVAFQLNFSAMTLLGGATDAMFRTVGAITMTINAEGSGQGGRDVNLDLLQAIVIIPAENPDPGPIPAPAPLLVILPGLAALLRCRRLRASE